MNTIHVTDDAWKKIKDGIKNEGIEDMTQLGVRLYVMGGGCSGFEYGFSYEMKEQEGDLIVENEGTKIYVDNISLPYLDGSTITCISSVAGDMLTIENPNAVSTCGCGHSFRVD